MLYLKNSTVGQAFSDHIFDFMKYLEAQRSMSIFVQTLNPLTGANDWVVQNEDYDHHQEVARSRFADMLHDSERNHLYEEALKVAIKKMHDRGKLANVLDIGTGTGLLSMMAVRHGADSVTACEAFKPMSECALKIMNSNGYKDKIKLIPKRSTSLVVAEKGDLQERCNILVTEVFDTELIGEGALSTFNHAHEHLLEKDCIVVPHSATIYAQIVECPFVQNFNKLKDIYNDEGELLIKVPPSVKNCRGSAAVHDLQLGQIPSHVINTLVSPLAVFQFDWSGKTPLVLERTNSLNITALKDGIAQAIFMWWELQMDQEGKIILSCAPKWAHPLSKCNPNVKIPWRDHWMQSIYYLPKEVPVKKNQDIKILSCHDEYSLWFNLLKDDELRESDYSNPVCDCGIHVLFSRTRIGQMNDSKRNKKYLTLLQKYIKPDSVVLILSDGFYFSLVASKLGAKKIFYLENNSFSFKILEEFMEFNNVTNVQIIKGLTELKNLYNLGDINLVFGEPYFITSILPWDNLFFIYLLEGMKQFLSNDVDIFPRKAIIKCIAVQFSDLHKIRCPLGKCEGFSMTNFDDLIKKASYLSDDNIEAQPLWEYPCIAVSKSVDIMELDLTVIPKEDYRVRKSVSIESNLECNGVAFWVDWLHDDFITTGPLRPTEIGQTVTWDIYTRQGVHLFPNCLRAEISFDFVFSYDQGNINITFDS